MWAKSASLAMITLIYGFLMYLPQTDLKRLLAYSTITQLVLYFLIGISLAALGSKLACVAAIATSSTMLSRKAYSSWLRFIKLCDWNSFYTITTRHYAYNVSGRGWIWV